MASTETKPYLILYSLDDEYPVREYSYTIFITKLRFRLLHGGVPFEDASRLRSKSPNKKIPYVKFLETGEVMADSAFIIKRLVQEGKLEDLNKDLSPELRAADVCLRALVDDKLFYITQYEWFFQNWKEFSAKSQFRHNKVKPITDNLMYLVVSIGQFLQGTGRLSAEEVQAIREEGVGALAAYAAAAQAKDEGSSRPFWVLGGEKPTEADFVIFGYLVSNLARPWLQPRLATVMRQHAALVDYVQRIHNFYFPNHRDIPELCARD